MSLFIGDKRVTFAQIGGTPIIPSTTFSLYMVGAITDALYTLNRTTGAATRVGTDTRFGVGESEPSGLAWDGTNLYMVGSEGSRLYVAITGPTQLVNRFGSVGTATQFDVNELSPTGLAWDGTNLYMVGTSTCLLYTSPSPRDS